MTAQTEPKAPFHEWVVLELMGHRRLGGLLTEQEIAGAAFLRIDVPADDGDGTLVSQFYSPSAVYAITPTTEEIARGIAKRSFEAPVTRYELPPAEMVWPCPVCEHRLTIGTRAQSLSCAYCGNWFGVSRSESGFSLGQIQEPTGDQGESEDLPI